MPSKGGGHLLLVDDEPAYLEALSEALVGFGFTVTALDNPEQAWERFRQKPEDFAALLTDHHMPGMSGIELAIKVAALRPGLPMVLCTGSPHTISQEIGDTPEPWRVMRKPFTMSELLEVLEQSLVKENGLK